jgi:hypothetical protein
LVHHLRNGKSLLGIEVDEAAKHIGIALQVAWILNEVILRSQTTGKHAVSVAQQFHLVRVE